MVQPIELWRSNGLPVSYAPFVSEFVFDEQIAAVVSFYQLSGCSKTLNLYAIVAYANKLVNKKIANQNCMKQTIILALAGIVLFSCETASVKSETKETSNQLVGTWKLLSGTLIEKGDTTVTDYTKDRSFVKIINDTHFAFFTA